MSRDQLIEEIRRAQRAIRRSRGNAPPAAPPVPPPAPEASERPDERAQLRSLLAELASRLDRTQEQLLARLGDLQLLPPGPATAAGTAAERGLLEEILSRLGDGPVAAVPNGEIDARLTAIEASLAQLGEAVSGGVAPVEVPELDFSRVEDGLARVERAIDSAHDRIHRFPDLGELTETFDTLSKKIDELSEPSTAPAGEAVAVDLGPLEQRLDRIEEKLATPADPTPVDLGGIETSLGRITEIVERLEERLSDPKLVSAAPAKGGGAPIDLGALDPKFEELLTAIQAPSESEDSATKAIGTLKRDFSLLVHTINGHLQESRHRSDQVESTLEELKAALVPIARHVGVEIGGAPEDGDTEETTGEEVTDSDG